MWFKIDINRLILMLVPGMLLREKHHQWLKALLYPLVTLHDGFQSFRLLTNRELRYNGQVIILENLLNDMFDTSDRRIVVQTSPSSGSQVYLPHVYEDDITPSYLQSKSQGEPVYIYHSDEDSFMVYDFMVIVPDGILTAQQESLLKSVTNKYKLDGKRPHFKYQNDQIF